MRASSRLGTSVLGKRNQYASLRYLLAPRVRAPCSMSFPGSQYHSASSQTAEQLPYSPAQHDLLDAAMQSVPAHGFTQKALAKGAQDAGYLPTSLALLPRGVFELVMFHLVTQRVGLKQRLPWQAEEDRVGDSPKDLDSKIRYTMLTRLRANAPLIEHYTNAIALMSLARNITPSLAELGRLSDEILYLAGDTSVDSSWYLRRGAIAGIYAATETFMSQDQSTEFKNTEKFLHRRLEDVRVLGQSAADVSQFLGFAGISTVNILRSWNIRI